MPFVFGSTKVSQKLSNTDVKSANCLLHEHFIPGEKYFLFLTDQIIHKIYLSLLIKDIETSGIKSYNIVSSISVSDPKDDSTVSLLSLESDWRKYITFNDAKCTCIVALGSALRILNKSADVVFYDFIDDTFNPPRYYCGGPFVNGPECWIYPVAKINDLYPITMGNDYVNMYTLYFKDKLKRIQNDDMGTDDLDLKSYSIFEITED
jgi:hypothetical protein